MPANGPATRPLKVFINYRRADTQGTAWAIYMKLEQHFGQENVFFDHGTLRAGVRWFDEIESQLAGCGVFIALIGQQWMQLLTSHLQDGDEDYVHREIDQALRAGQRLTVIPVLVDGAELPEADQLPLSLRALPACQAERLRPTNLPADIDHLITRLEEVRSTAIPEPAPEPASLSNPGPIVPRPVDEQGWMEEHYRRVAGHAGSLVVFLGAWRERRRSRRTVASRLRDAA